MLVTGFDFGSYDKTLISGNEHATCSSTTLSHSSFKYLGLRSKGMPRISDSSITHTSQSRRRSTPGGRGEEQQTPHPSSIMGEIRVHQIQ